MQDDIIKKKLREVGLSYTLTPKYFQIPRENNMSSKAPKWFSDWSTEFEKRNNARFDRLEAKVDKNTNMILENRNMILKAHPEFNK